MVTQRVEILLATYKPNPSFLAIQLESLNRQSYPNLFLRVRDDSADDITYAAIETALTSTITAFPFELSRNSENIGSNSTFELLTRDANGDWIAYCDQDDDWLPEKISNLVRLANQQKAVLAYSDESSFETCARGRIVRFLFAKKQRHGLYDVVAHGYRTESITL
jgi:glycosyltransferase involved in cell wall biosynthesis